MLQIENLNVKIAGKEIISDLSLTIKDGETHILMGQNGSGKTTLCYAIMGHPKYAIKGRIILDKEDIQKLPVNARAKKGIFLAFQNPVGIEGLKLHSFIRKTKNTLNSAEDLITFRETTAKIAKEAGINNDLLSRDLNIGLSGGEKKKSEIIQMLAISPKFAILDEIDSGLDVDAIKKIAKAIEKTKDGKKMFLIITHHANILKYIKPDIVHIMINGKIIKTGNSEIAKQIEKRGYEWLIGK